MSSYSNWQKDQEERRILQMAIYEVALENPHKPYHKIANEFGISTQTAMNLLKDYCEALSIDNPKRKGFIEKSKDPSEIEKNSRNKKRAKKELSDKTIINGKRCTIQKENSNTLIVIFEGEFEPIVVVKKTNEEIRQKNKRDYNNPIRSKKHASH